MFIDQEEFDKKLEILEAIEKSTGVDMGFQKGKLSVEAGRTVICKKPSDPEYSSYDAGIAFAEAKLQLMLEEMKRQLSSREELNNMFGDSSARATIADMMKKPVK